MSSSFPNTANSTNNLKRILLVDDEEDVIDQLSMYN